MVVTGPDDVTAWQVKLDEESPAVGDLYRVLVERESLRVAAPALARAYKALVDMFSANGTLYICGNGGSMADALHIAAELDKSFRHPRGLTEAQRNRLLAQLDGGELAVHLQQGLRTIALGANPALASAIANDNPLCDIGFAQELYALGRPGDVLLGISTSGKAQNVRYAASVAHALEMTVISLTGPEGEPLASQADIAIHAPGRDTPETQAWHIQLYHVLCDMLEAGEFGS